MSVIEIVALVCLVIGAFFAFTGVLGILRFKDFYARAQASTCISTMGGIGAMACGIVMCAFFGMPAIWIVKLVMIELLVMIGSAIGGHALSKAVHRRGHRPEGGFVKDDYEEDGCDEL